MALADCTGCFQYFRDRIIGPIPNAILGPYVKMVVEGGGFNLTVGNASCPSKGNTACIKSFQYGQDDGNGAEIEIFDEAGGEFAAALQWLVTDMDQALQKYKVKIEWGWVVADCDGQPRLIKTCLPHIFSIIECDINFGSGGMSYKLGLIDLVQFQLESTVTKNFGEDTANKRMKLKEAIRKMFREAKPPVNNVDFIRMKQKPNSPDCSFTYSSQVLNCQPRDTEEFDFENFTLGDAQGTASEPTYRWEAGNNSALAAARAWIMYYMTRKRKGIITFWDSTVPGGKLVFMEDPTPPCPDQNPTNMNSIGTYIVNGGKLSPVISFSPNMKWTFAAAAQSGAVTDPTGRPARMSGPPGCDTENVGGPSTGTGSRPAVPQDVTANGGNSQSVVNAAAANEKANKPAENIEAELRIQGDPYLDDPYTIKTKTVALMVVNPFHLRGQTNPSQPCIDWLAVPPCNNCLSNKNWIIKAVSHEIKEGSYTTTLKVLLPRPCDNAA